MFDIKNKTIVITGGSGLIGSAFSASCAEFGANVVIIDINEEKGNKLLEDIKQKTKNDNVVFVKCDITSEKDVENMIELTLDRFKRIDALVNSAYPKNKNYGRKFEDVSYEDFCQNINMHLGGYFLISQKISKVMIKQNCGNIINIASIYGFTAPKFEIYKDTEKTMPVEYSAIKSGIINFTRYLASYLGRYNIRVNAISPGGVFDNQEENFVRNYCQKVVLGKRMAESSDLTGVLIFLISQASKYITGQNIIVDGGFTL
ncbi:MAG: oxidoreductase [Candidatus Pacebacteria bacterium]|nr:oxidoreductase [Candidatus Paceibacterota bacterium]